MTFIDISNRLAVKSTWVYFMTFIDISNHLAVKATCTNRKCNISVFEGPTSGFEKNYGLHRVTIEASPNSEKRLGK